MKGFLNQEELARFIDLVCQHPLLYDPTAKHSDIQSTKAVWSSITAEMDTPNMSATDWKSKWKCLRDTFVKKKREIRLADTQEKIEKATQWRFYHNMIFLDPFVDKICFKPYKVPRSNGIDYQHYTIIKNEDYQDGESGEEGEEYSTVSFGKQQSSEDASTTRGLRKRKKRNEDFEVTETSALSSNAEDDDSWNAEGSNSKSFFDSCSYRMDKLPERVQSYLQLQISQLFFNAENPDVPSLPIMPLPPAPPPPPSSSSSS